MANLGANKYRNNQLRSEKGSAEKFSERARILKNILERKKKRKRKGRESSANWKRGRFRRIRENDLFLG